MTIEGRGMRDTGYARELARADVDGNRIERLYVKQSGEEEIRFSWWKDGRMQTRPLDLPEHDLLPLLAEAIRRGVFSKSFLSNLHSLLSNLPVPSQGPKDEARPVLPEHSMAMLSSPLELDDGRTLPADARGAIVAVWGAGEAYEVEFSEPFHVVATVPAGSLSAPDNR